MFEGHLFQSGAGFSAALYTYLCLKLKVPTTVYNGLPYY